MKRFIIDGNKVVLNKPSSEYKAEEFEFQENEVGALWIMPRSGGEGQVNPVQLTECFLPPLLRSRID